MSTAIPTPGRRYWLAALTIFTGSGLTFWLQPMVGRILLPHYGGSASVWVVCLAAFQLLLLAGYGYAWAVSKLPPRGQRLGHLLLLGGALLLAWRGPASGSGAITDTTGVAAAVLLDIIRLAAGPFILIAAGSTLIQAWLAASPPSPPTLSRSPLSRTLTPPTSSPTLTPPSPPLTTPNSQLTSPAAPAGAAVYRLYAWGNLGSLCGLLLYPLALEPFISTAAQHTAWAVAMSLYALLLAALAASSHSSVTCGKPQVKCSVFSVQCSAPPFKHPPLNANSPAPASPSPPITSPSSPITSSPITYYLSLITLKRCLPAPLYLPALSSALLCAVTAQVTQAVIALPLIWAILLAAFLLSWVAGFSDAAVRRLARWRTAALLFIAATPLLYLDCDKIWLAIGLIAYGALLLFTTGVWLHASLYALRPAARHLPRYYFLIALGGAVGGSLASLAAPLLFPALWELPLALIALLYVTTPSRRANPVPSGAPVPLRLLALIGIIIVCWQSFAPSKLNLWRGRSFYGAVDVWAQPLATESGGVGTLRGLSHGLTRHGMQYFKFGWERRPLAYFTPDSGAGLAVAALRGQAADADRPLHIGVVGLGIGTLCAYGLPGDTITCYEISRPVIEAARNRQWFTYVTDCLAAVEIKEGDGRRLLEAERRQGAPRFDLLYLDAFAGDSPPLHLLTAEAFALYFDRLAADGILAVNISNWHMDLLPLGKAVAARFNVAVEAVLAPEILPKLQHASIWLLFSRQPRAYNLPPGARRCDWGAVADLPLPSDAQGSALRYLGTAAAAAWQ